MQKSLLGSNCLGLAAVIASAVVCLCDNDALAGPPANDQCANAISIAPGSIAFDTTGATTDGPPSVACQDGSPDQQVNQDIWFNYAAPGIGILTVSLCGSNFNTKLAVYDGCTCVNGNLNLLMCDDNTCGQQSQVMLVTNEGGCYQIRVGGFGSATGSGTLTLEQQLEKDPPPLCPNENECCTGAGSAGCNNAACCSAVCAVDPFCCETLWDSLCAAQAQKTPECVCIAPANDNC
ncbi:MAG: hypothetical protein L0219_18550, partial [Phycisphaerales bacterium]|nr:hypothetical protein [Phycisphaerales bacterium]